MKAKKLLSMLVAATLATAALAGCGSSKDDGKVSITIGNAPVEGQAGYERYMERMENFRTAHPDWTVESSSFTYDTKNFMAKAAADQLPTTWSTFFTEVGLISEQGYCKDISKNLKAVGLDKVLNPDSLAVVTGENGEIWGVPNNAYAQGLHINKKLFKEAGLVNDDGSIKVPQTWDEVAEFAGVIKEKTGMAGFAMPSKDNIGGWHFMNIAWSYGTEFEKQDADGKWKATFDSKEFKDALEWLYDIKWNKNGLVNSAAMDIPAMQQNFGTYQAGMFIANPPINDLITQYGMDIDDIMVVRMPAGPEGRVAQTGGGIYMFNANATDAEVEAALAWYMEQSGFSIEVTDATVDSTEKDLQSELKNGKIILNREVFPNCVNRKDEERLNEIREKYCNVDMDNYNDYLSFEDVTLRAEEPVACQQLYSVLDGVIQEILTNKDVNIDELVKTAVNDFQKNHLDNL